MLAFHFTSRFILHNFYGVARSLLSNKCALRSFSGLSHRRLLYLLPIYMSRYKSRKFIIFLTFLSRFSYVLTCLFNAVNSAFLSSFVGSKFVEIQSLHFTKCFYIIYIITTIILPKAALLLAAKNLTL